MIKDYDKDCPLCRLVEDREIKSRLVHEDDTIMVVDCIVCRVPMAVLKEHRSDFSPEEEQYVRDFFRDLIKNHPIPLEDDVNLEEMWGGEYLVNDPATTPWVIDWEQRKIPAHAHCHLRPKAFPKTEHWEKLNID